MDESLLPSDGNDNGNRERGDIGDLSASQASLERSASLLERIRAQRERETMVASLSELPTHTGTAETDGINIPQYDSPIANDAIGSDTGLGHPPHARSFLDASSLNFSGFIRGLGSRHPLTTTSNEEYTRGLLDASASSANNGSYQYSMGGYFRMFAMDVYTYFRSMPIPVQAGVIVFMLWIIYHLI